MKNEIVVLCTCADPAEADRIASAVVEGRFAACVNVLPPVRSVFRWEGNVETASEILLLIKTTAPRFPALRDAIRQIHSYDTPEIIALPIVQGSEEYLGWIRGQV